MVGKYIREIISNFGLAKPKAVLEIHEGLHGRKSQSSVEIIQFNLQFGISDIS